MTLGVPANVIMGNTAIAQVIRREQRKAASAAVSAKRTNSLQSQIAALQFNQRQGEPSPFLPYKPPSALNHRAPRMSTRRFKQLFLASDNGQGLPEGPKGKADKLLQRAQLRAEGAEKESELLALAKRFWPTTSTAESMSRAAYLQDRGPYKGRFLGEGAVKAFKGSAWERKRPERQAEIRSRMSKMDQRVAEWKKVCRQYTVCEGSHSVFAE